MTSLRSKPHATEEQRITNACRFIEERAGQAITLDELARQAAMSKFHFARRFKSIVGMTPGQYAAGIRTRRFKGELQSGKPLDAALYDSGYGSPSRVYESAAHTLGMTPAQYRRAGRGVTISHAALETPAGRMLIGATDRGICYVQFGESAEDLLERLRAEFPEARIEAMNEPPHPQFAAWVAAIERHLTGEATGTALPLDIRATAFQMRVWRYLQSIPFGDVQSYGEVAAAIGAPAAVRAVASACAHNPVAVVVPCHRVIRQSGELGGYRWGIERKRALLDHERAKKKRATPVRAALRGTSTSA